jgi:hypothetical protein
MDLSMRAEDLAGRFSVLGAGFGFVLGLAFGMLAVSIKQVSLGKFFTIWLGGIGLGTGGGAALGIGLALVGTH